jgi:hypothetical protein
MRSILPLSLDCRANVSCPITSVLVSSRSEVRPCRRQYSLVMAPWQGASSHSEKDRLEQLTDGWPRVVNTVEDHWLLASSICGTYIL